MTFNTVKLPEAKHSFDLSPTQPILEHSIARRRIDDWHTTTSDC